MIRILHYGLSMNTGGIETYLYKLWKHIDEKTFHFDFIDTNLGSPCFYDEFIEMGSKFYKITPRSVSIKKNKEDLYKLFETHSFDILHCHLNTLSYIEPIKIALKFDCKVIVHSRSSNAPDKLTTKLLHRFNSHFLPSSSIEKIAVSNLAGEWLFGKKNNFQIINNGIDVKKFQFDEDIRNQIRTDLHLEGKFVVGNVGAFLFPKNHQFLLKIFYEFTKMKPDSILVLVGDGPLKREIIDQIADMNLQDKVLLLGRRNDISDLLSAMDCFLFPSLYEGFPNSVLEAQTCGLPCIISDKITNEIVINKSCRQLSLACSPKKWANEMLHIDRQADRLTESLTIINAGYSVEDEIKKVESLYLSVFK